MKTYTLTELLDARDAYLLTLSDTDYHEHRCTPREDARQETALFLEYLTLKEKAQ